LPVLWRSFLPRFLFHRAVGVMLRPEDAEAPRPFLRILCVCFFFYPPPAFFFLAMFPSRRNDAKSPFFLLMEGSVFLESRSFLRLHFRRKAISPLFSFIMISERCRKVKDDSPLFLSTPPCARASPFPISLSPFPFGFLFSQIQAFAPFIFGCPKQHLHRGIPKPARPSFNALTDMLPGFLPVDVFFDPQDKSLFFFLP